VGKRKRTILDDLMVLPWWCSPIAALVAYLGIGIVLPAIVPQDPPAFAAFPTAMPKIAPYVAFVLLVPMPFAYLNGRRKRRLVDTNKDLDSIRALSWLEFEQLVAEAYRRKGYRVRENLTLGPDGGVDVSLEKDGQLHLVQCKQWKSQKVGVKVVREMYGVMVDQGAASVIIVCSGMFTQEAKNFADSKPIDLIDGPQLTALIAGIQVGSVDVAAPVQAQPSTVSSSCPKCGSELIMRTARRGSNAGNQFMGCSGFPKCRYTQDA
jgi:restriction system protein